MIIYCVNLCVIAYYMSEDNSLPKYPPVQYLLPHSKGAMREGAGVRGVLPFDNKLIHLSSWFRSQKLQLMMVVTTCVLWTCHHYGWRRKVSGGEQRRSIIRRQCKKFSDLVSYTVTFYFEKIMWRKNLVLLFDKMW